MGELAIRKKGAVAHPKPAEEEKKMEDEDAGMAAIRGSVLADLEKRDSWKVKGENNNRRKRECYSITERRR